MGLKHIIGGILTYVPKVDKLMAGRTGGTNSARYCYCIWLRHLVMAQSALGGACTWPKVIAEFGPGDSLGIGLAALLSGAEKYYALDVVEYADTSVNLDILEELIALFAKKEPIPDQQEFPLARPLLPSYEFPHKILTEDRLQQCLTSERIRSIKEALINVCVPRASSLVPRAMMDDRRWTLDGIEIHYVVPWYDSDVIKQESVDMIFSQAVLEHVDNLAQTYATLYRWLKRDGFMSHQIDFGCHSLAKKWNGHWAYSDFTWKLIKGKRFYLLNREPYSTHKRLLEQTGFTIVCEVKTSDHSGLAKEQLSSRFRQMSEEDLTTRTVHILARKERRRAGDC